MAPRPALSRLTDRPRPVDWQPDDLITVVEAMALFFPNGPLTANGLRLAYARGQLGGVEIGGKLFTTPAAVAAMTTARPKIPSPPSFVTPAVAQATPEPCRLPAKLQRRIAAAKRRRGVP